MATLLEKKKAKQIKYWSTRTRKRKVNQEKYTNKQIQGLLKYYRESLKQLNRMVGEVYDKYSSDTGLGITELVGILTGVERKEFLSKVKERMEILGLVPEDVYNQKMLARITRVEALKEQAYWEMRRLQAIQEIQTTRVLNSTMERSYDLIMKDYMGSDYQPGTFTRFNPGLPEQVLKERWSGKNYSERVWGRQRSDMAKSLPIKIAGSLISGQSYHRTSLEIRKEYNVMQWEAMRLVRTESAYVDGQANKEAMLDVDITQYTLDVTLDSRTSDICGAIDETEVHNYKDAVVGENLQPFHPNCRTVDQPLTSTESVENAKSEFAEKLETLEQEKVSSEDIYPSGFKSAYDFIMSKQEAEREKGNFNLTMQETENKVTMRAMGTKERKLGVELMEQLKEYIDFTHKLLVVKDIQNSGFFDDIEWLEPKKSIKSYMYSPIDEKVIKEVKKSSPLVKDKRA